MISAAKIVFSEVNLLEKKIGEEFGADPAWEDVIGYLIRISYGFEFSGESIKKYLKEKFGEDSRKIFGIFQKKIVERREIAACNG